MNHKPLTRLAASLLATLYPQAGRGLRCRFFAAVPAYRHRVPWEGDILAAGTQTRHCAGKLGVMLRAFPVMETTCS
ncbi:MAG: hypothetical protein QOH67_520 [Hyphomicrobiales bacterium]|jgi:hypothetical protein|nr:hypothetical protein [Hyphomicrobiales bacterium]